MRCFESLWTSIGVSSPSWLLKISHDTLWAKLCRTEVPGLVSRCQIWSVCVLGSCHRADQVNADPVLKFGFQEPTRNEEQKAKAHSLHFLHHLFDFITHSYSRPSNNNKTYAFFFCMGIASYNLYLNRKRATESKFIFKVALNIIQYINI